MEMNIIINQFEVEVKLVERSDNIKAFINWIFHTSEGQIKIRGGTMKLKQPKFAEEGETMLSYDVPAYRGKFKYYGVLFIDNKNLFKKLCTETMRRYCEESGVPFDATKFIQEEVNIDDIPL